MLMTPVLYLYNLITILFFVSTIFNKGAYLTLKSIFHKALKDGIIATWDKASISLLKICA